MRLLRLSMFGFILIPLLQARESSLTARKPSIAEKSDDAQHSDVLTYDDWKEGIHKKWQEEGMQKFATQLLCIVNRMSEEIKEDPATLYAQTRYAYGYTLLRELLCPEEPIQHFSCIDHEWLKQVQEAVRLYQFLEQENYQLPSRHHVQLLKEAQERTGIKADICLALCPNQGSWTYVDAQDETKNYIALCQASDVDLQMCFIYHELAHVAYKDSIHKVQIESGDKKPQDFLNELLFKEDLASVKKYRALGKKAFDDTTDLGKKVKDRLARSVFFWSPPIERGEYENMVYFKGVEQRADLFACRKLLEHGKLSAILRYIVHLLASDYVIAEGSNDTHPSDFDRALYCAGFLVENGVDINKALQELTIKEPVLPDSMYVPCDRPLTPGARDFLRAYQEWQEAWEKHRYEQWKQNLLDQAEAEGISSDQEIMRGLASLVCWRHELAILESKKASRPIPEHTRVTLYAYNFLRELAGQPSAKSFSDIDLAWVNSAFNINEPMPIFMMSLFRSILQL